MSATPAPQIGSPEWLAEQKKLRDAADEVLAAVNEIAARTGHNPQLLLGAAVKNMKLYFEAWGVVR